MPQKDYNEKIEELKQATDRMNEARSAVIKDTGLTKSIKDFLEAASAVDKLKDSLVALSKTTEDWTKDSAIAHQALLSMLRSMEDQASALRNLQKTQSDYVLTLENSARLYSTSAMGLKANVKQLEEFRFQMSLTRAEAIKMGDSLQGAVARGFDKNKLVEYQKALTQVLGRERGQAVFEKVLQKERVRPGFVNEAVRGSERAYSMASGDQELKQAIQVLNRPNSQTASGREASGLDYTEHWLKSFGDSFSENAAKMTNRWAGRAAPFLGAGAGAAVKTGGQILIFMEMVKQLREIAKNTRELAGPLVSKVSSFFGGGKGRFGGKLAKVAGKVPGLGKIAGKLGLGGGATVATTASTAAAEVVGAGGWLARVGGLGGLAKGAGVGALIGVGGTVLGDAIQDTTEKGSWSNMAGKALSVGSSVGGWATTGAMVGSIVPGVGNVAGAIGGGLLGAGIEGYKYFTRDPEEASASDKEASAGFSDEMLADTKDQLRQALTSVEDSYAGYARDHSKATVDYYQAIGTNDAKTTVEMYDKYLTQTKAASATFIEEVNAKIKALDEQIGNMSDKDKFTQDDRGRTVNTAAYSRLLSAKEAAETAIQSENTKNAQLGKFGARFSVGSDVNERSRALAQSKLQAQESAAEMSKLVGLPFEAIKMGAKARVKDATAEIERIDGEIGKALKIKMTSPVGSVASQEADVKIAELSAKRTQQRVSILKTQLQTTAELFQAINDLPDLQVKRAAIEGVQVRREIAGAVGGLSAEKARSLGREEADLAREEYNIKREETAKIRQEAEKAIQEIQSNQNLKPEERDSEVKLKRAEIQKADNELARSQAASIKAEKQARLEGLQIERDIMNSRRETLETEKGTADYLGASYSQIYDIQKGIVSAAQEQRENTLSQMREMERLGAEANDPEYVKLQAQYARETADIMKASMSAQRDFLDKALGKAFGVGQGSKFQPLVNTRMLLGGNYRQTESGLQIADTPKTLAQGAFEAQGVASRRLGIGTGQKPELKVGGKIDVAVSVGPNGLNAVIRQQSLEATSVSGMV